MNDATPLVTSERVFVTGGTGYIGRSLIGALLAAGRTVLVLTRPESVCRVPEGAEIVVGDALDSASIGAALRPGDTLVHLVGTAHPSPRKTREFVAVDLASVRAAIAAARTAGVRHFVYLSVAQPAPVMKTYVAVRAEGERLLSISGLTATVLRPWYVIGPGHRWPLVLMPLYWAAERVPALRHGAERLGLVSLHEMVEALRAAIDAPPRGGLRIVEVPGIRSGAAHDHQDAAAH